MSRLTSAQSTLCLNDTSVTKLERNKIINRTFGAFIKNSFNVFDINFSKDDLHLIASASHNAYEKKFGYIHKRSLSISKKNSELKGTDFLIKKGNTSPKVNYHIRFHLADDMVLNFTNNKKNIILKTKMNNIWLFKSNTELIIEDSISVDNNITKPTKQIVIKGVLSDKKIIEKWSLEKI